MTRRDSFLGDRRGLAIGISEFAAMIAIAAFLFVLLDPAIGELAPMMLDGTSDQQATAQINRADTIWSLILYFVMAVALLFVIARAVAESNTGF